MLKKTLALTALTLSLSTNVSSEIVATYSGTFSSASDDVFGLVGTSFEWVGIFDETASRVYTNNVNLDSFAGDVTFTLIQPGGVSDSYSLTGVGDELGELVTSQTSTYFFWSFGAGGLIYDPGNINVELGALGTLGPANTLSVAAPLTFGQFFSGQFFSVFSEDFSLNANYQVTDASLVFSQVPVPAAAWLFGSALIGLAGIKRKK